MTPVDAFAPPTPEVARPLAGRAEVAREQIDDLVRLFARRNAADATHPTACGAAAPPWSPETRRRLLESLRASRATPRSR